MPTDEEQIKKLTINFQRGRKRSGFYDKEMVEEIKALYGEDAVKEDKEWVATEVSSWYKRMTQIDPRLTQEQKYSIARKFLKYRFGARYYERKPKNLKHAQLPSENEYLAAFAIILTTEKLEKLIKMPKELKKEFNKAMSKELDSIVKSNENEAFIAAIEYISELIKKEKAKVSEK